MRTMNRIELSLLTIVGLSMMGCGYYLLMLALFERVL